MFTPSRKKYQWSMHTSMLLNNKDKKVSIKVNSLEEKPLLIILSSIVKNGQSYISFSIKEITVDHNPHDDYKVMIQNFYKPRLVETEINLDKEVTQVLMTKEFIFDEDNGFLAENYFRFLINVVDDDIFVSDVPLLTTSDKDFENYLQNEKYSDVSIIVDDRKIPAHKIILAAASPVFDTMLKHNTMEKKKNEIHLTNVDYNIVEEMLKFIYDDYHEICSVKIAQQLLIVGDKYDVKNLVEKCEAYLYEKLWIDNALAYLQLAVNHNAPNLKSKAISFIKKHLSDISQIKGFKDIINELSNDVKVEIISSLSE